MAVAPEARLQTVAYEGGTATGPKGLLDYLFGDPGQLGWAVAGLPGEDGGGRRRRKYGTKQRENARAGEPMQLNLANGEAYTVRITGTHIDFIDFFLARGGGVLVLNVYSERGTIYGPQVAPFADDNAGA